MVGVGFFIYFNSLQGGFQFDDYEVIVSNEYLHHAQNILWIWQYDPSRFLPHLSFTLNYTANQNDVFFYHIINVALHILCAFLVFLLIRLGFLKNNFYADAEKERLSLFSALIFLVHPLQTESVTYIVQRSTVMVAVFYIAGLISYLLWREKEKTSFYDRRNQQNCEGNSC